MITLHAVRGVTSGLHSNFEAMLTRVENVIEVYSLKIDKYNVNKIADDLAKIQAIINDNSMVVCTSDRMLGDVGVSLDGGIKAAFNSDVYSTIEQRQEYATKETLKINEHLESSLYPEYWVNGAAIQHVWVNANESYASDLSQLCGMILGLLVVNAA